MIYYLYEESGRDNSVMAEILEGPDGLDLETLQDDFIKEMIGDPPPRSQAFVFTDENLKLEQERQAWLKLKREKCKLEVFMKRYGLEKVQYKEAECLLVH